MLQHPSSARGAYSSGQTAGSSAAAQLALLPALSASVQSVTPQTLFVNTLQTVTVTGQNLGLDVAQLAVKLVLLVELTFRLQTLRPLFFLLAATLPSVFVAHFLCLTVR